jgi:5-methylcytosine-specific restriction endonuclease McrA
MLETSGYMTNTLLGDVDVSILTHKCCTKCGETKPLADFGRDAKKKDGRHSWCKSCISCAAAVWNKKNPEKNAEHVKRWFSFFGNKEKKAEKRRARGDAEALLLQKRRARIAGNGGIITPEEWQELKKFYNFTCLCCGRQEPEITLTLDHVVPIKLGGANTIQNAQPLCQSCNSKKYTKVIDYR